MEILPKAMAMPKDTSTLPQGKYGPIYPKSPACYGFTIIAKIIPGREPVFYEYAQNIEQALGSLSSCNRSGSMMASFLGPEQTTIQSWVRVTSISRCRASQCEDAFRAFQTS